MNGNAGKRMINLGCGSRYHRDWVNVDICPRDPAVQKIDFTRGLPFPDGSFDVVYHAAVLEHVRRPDTAGFISECFRVLRPAGIIRVGVPDLERICKEYLSALAGAASGDAGSASNYDWIMLEMYDQCVRERSGGDMLEFLARPEIPNEKFVLDRIGAEGEEIIREIRTRSGKCAGDFKRRAVRSLEASLHNYLNPVWRVLKAFQIGHFRMSGESHQWMYDRFSLSKLLSDAGFVNPIVQSAARSQISGWNSYELDMLESGKVLKPDLLFMEGMRP